MLSDILTLWTRYSLTARTLEHLTMFGIALTFALIIGIMVGVLLYRHEKYAGPVLNFLNVVETFPDLALLVLLIPFVGIGAAPTIVACVLYSILPIARNAYTGLTHVSREHIDVAEALGLTGNEILLYIRIPLALPLIAGGIRIAIVFTMGIVTLGGLIGAGGLGAPLQTGIFANIPMLIVIAGIWVGILAVILDGLAGIAEAWLAGRFGEW
jgi:osmoprotectant transport system permease protein